MANDDLVRVAVTGDVYVAPVGTTLPIDVTTSLNAAFKKVGYLTPDALTEGLDVTTEYIRAWQKKAGVRTVVTEFNWTWQFSALETSPIVLELFYGATDNSTAGGVTTTEIPLEIPSVEKAMVIEIIDGDVITRYVLPRVMISDRGDASHTGSDGTSYDITVSVMGDATALGYRLTNDPAFVALAS